MSKVSDMIKMYSQQNTTTGPKPPPSVARKWPPVNTSSASANKPPPPSAPKPALNGTRPNFPSKPSALHPGGRSTAPWATPKTVENNTPPWQRNRTDHQDKTPLKPTRPWENKEDKPVPPWKQKQPDRNDTPSWMNRQRQKQEEEERKTDSLPRGRNSWGKQSPPSHVLPAPVPAEEFPRPPSPWKNTPPPPIPKTAPEPEFPEDEDMYLESQSPAHYPPPINISPPKKPFSSGFNGLPKPPGSYTSSSPLRNSNHSEEKAGRRNQSFLHAPAGSAAPKFPGPMPTGPKPSGPKPTGPKPTGPKPSNLKLSNEDSLPPPPPPSDKPARVNGVPPRLQIPPEKYSQPAPIKQSKPPKVVLPIKGKKKLRISPLSKPKSPMRDLPPPPPQDDLPPVSSRDMEPPPLPPPMARNLPPPPSQDTPPSLSNRRPLPSPTPDKKSLPLPALPPTPGAVPLPPEPSDDIYEDTTDTPPALPPMRQPAPPPQQQTREIELIPTYESDEEEQGAIYDETPDDLPQAGSQFPSMSGYSPAGTHPPEPEEISEDMYEDVEEYMRLKKLQRPSPQSNPGPSEGLKKDKKKNASEKKEKDSRKKFKLPLEGDISPVGKGRVKENMKGGWGSSKGLAVSADEWIDVIRMTDNPKGKWLARNANGEYGYVDSDKVEISTNDLRSMMGGHGMGGDSSVPQIATIGEDEEVIYDQTADEDIYEEV